MPPAKPGERRLQILKVLAQMLQDPKGEKITTAALANKLDVSEAALYRHFASKAQMFEGLIEFIETTVFTLVNKIQAEEKDAMKQVESTVATLLALSLSLTVAFTIPDVGVRWLYYLPTLAGFEVFVNGSGAWALDRAGWVPGWLRS